MHIFSQKLYKLIENDSRSSLERGARKRPKIDYLILIENEIKKLLLNLYSVSDMLSLINNANKKFSVSDTTLLKFLKTFLYDEHTFNHKMRLIAYKTSYIHTLFENKKTVEEIYSICSFTGKINGNTKVEISFEDFLFFIENYYKKDIDTFFVSDLLDSKKEIEDKKQSIVPELPVKNEVIVEPKIKEVKTQNSNNKNEHDIFYKQEHQIYKELEDNIVLYKNSLAFKDYVPTKDIFTSLTPLMEIRKGIGLEDIDIFILRDKTDEAIELRSKVKALMKNVKPQIKIHYNDRDFWEYDELANHDMLGIEHTDYQEECFKEKFYFFYTIETLQYIDLNTIELTDGMLIVTTKQNEKIPDSAGRYSLFRYYKGEIYFYKTFDSDGNSPSFRDNVEKRDGFTMSHYLLEICNIL